MKQNIEKLMDLAEYTAYLSDRSKHKTGCVLTDKKNNVISFGCNSNKTHPTQFMYATKAGNPLACHLHAEISALIRIKSETNVDRAYVVRAMKNGKRGMAKPCNICKAALLDKGVNQIYYSNKYGETTLLRWTDNE